MISDRNDFPSSARPKHTGNRQRLGIVASLAYVGAAALYAWLNLSQFALLKPNELGDVLAGLCAPLAFLWLVLGFFQQGDELRNSADALWLQGRELQNSVEQQRRLVDTQEAQLIFDRERLAADREEVRRQSQPDFIFTGGGVSSLRGITQIRLRVLNRGRACSDFRLEVEGHRLGKHLFSTGESLEVNVEIPSNSPVGVRKYTATFVDALGNHGQATLQLEAIRDGNRTILRP